MVFVYLGVPPGLARRWGEQLFDQLFGQSFSLLGRDHARVRVLNSSSHSAVVLCVCSLPREVWCVCSLPRGVWHFYRCLSPMVTMVLPGRMARGPLGVAISTSIISSWFPRTLIHWWCRGSTVLRPSPVLDNCTSHKRGTHHIWIHHRYTLPDTHDLFEGDIEVVKTPFHLERQFQSVIFHFK